MAFDLEELSKNMALFVIADKESLSWYATFLSVSFHRTNRTSFIQLNTVLIIKLAIS